MHQDVQDHEFRPFSIAIRAAQPDNHGSSNARHLLCSALVAETFRHLGDEKTVRRSSDFVMFTFLFNIAFDLLTGVGKKAIDAAAALEKPAISPAAQRYRTAAVVLFLSTSAFLVAAAIAFTIAPQDMLNEILGWTGIVCLHLCVLCGLRYSAINRPV